MRTETSANHQTVEAINRAFEQNILGLTVRDLNGNPPASAADRGNIITGMQNSATVGGGNSGNIVCHMIGPVDPVLEIVKNSDLPSVAPGGVIPWTVTIRNTGGGSATNVRVYDVLAANMPAHIIFSFPTVPASISAIPPGESRTVTVNVQVNEVIPPGIEEICNTAWVTAENHDRMDATGPRLCVPLNLPDLVVRVTADQEVVAPGAAISFEVSRCNDGAAPLPNSSLFQTPTGGGTFNLGANPRVRATTVVPPHTCDDPFTITGTAPTLPANQCEGSITLTSVGSTTVTEVTTDNNTGSDTIRVERNPCTLPPDVQTEIHRYDHHDWVIYPDRITTFVEPVFAANPAYHNNLSAGFESGMARTQYGLLSDTLIGRSLSRAAIQGRVLQAARRDMAYEVSGANSVNLNDWNVEMLTYGGIVNVREETVSRRLRTLSHEYITRERHWQPAVPSIPLGMARYPIELLRKPTRIIGWQE